MKKLLLSLIFLPVLSWSAQKPSTVKELDINNFSKGVDTYHDSTQLQDGYIQDALNIYVDKQAPIEKRGGYTTLFTSKTYSYNNTWTYTDGSNVTWLIVRASDTLIASNLAGNSVVKISTVSANDTVDEVNAFGNAYFVDPTQGVYYWNGAATTYVAGSPKGSIITQFHSRVWVSGQAVPNGNLLNASKFLDGTTWTTGLNPTDPAQFTIGLQDNFDNITALYPFLDTLYVMKYTSIYALYGFDNTNFQNSIINRECGCVDKYSIQAFNKGMVFSSLRGLEFYDGYNCTRISDPIKNKMDAAINLTSFSQNSWVQQGLTDWSAGTFSNNNNISTMTVSPAMQWKGAGLDSVRSDFTSGSLTGLSWNSVGLQISTDTDSNVYDNSFELGSTSWTLPGTTSIQTSDPVGVHCFGTAPKDGSKMMHYGSTFGTQPASFDVKVLHCGDAVQLGKTTISSAYAGSCAWIQTSISLATADARKCAYIEIDDTTNSHTATVSSEFLMDGVNMTFYYLPDGTSGIGPDMNFDLFQSGRVSQENASQISRVFDTGKTSSTVIPKISWSISGATPSFVLQTSTDNVIGWADVTTATGVAKSVNRYVRYLSTWTFNPSLTLDFRSSWSSVDIQPFIFVSTWTSACHNLGSISSFGNLAATTDLTGGGTIAFTVCSSANSNCTSATCAVISANSQITVATNTYAQIITTFTATISTQTATLNSATVQWFSGSKANPMASAVYDNRYWLSVTTSSVDSANDTVIVLNTVGAFSLFDIHAGGLVVIRNNLYHSDSNSTGKVYEDNQGYDDNGVAVNAYVRTRDYNLGSLIVDTLFDSFWPSMNNLGSYNVKFYYALDKGITDYQLATVNQSEFASTKFARIMFPMSTSNPGIAQTVNFKIQANDLGEPWQFQGLSLLYHERPIQE